MAPELPQGGGLENCPRRDDGPGNVLGLSIGHDRSAALVANGEIVAAVAEERLDRNKHSWGNTLPLASLREVLEIANVDWDEVDAIALSNSGLSLSESRRQLASELRNLPPSVPVHFAGHHDAHAASAWYCSPFEDAAVWVADGGGDDVEGFGQEAETYYIADSRALTRIHARYQPALRCPLTDERVVLDPADRDKQISLGRKYEQLTYLLGFRFGESGKTMGLAAYGRPSGRWSHGMRLPESLEPDLRVSDLIGPILDTMGNAGIVERAADIAAEVQELVEDYGLALVRNLHAKTGQKHLCMAGGLALNCVMNGRIAREGPFSSLFVFPAAGDDGQAIGSALHTYFKLGGTRRVPFRCASLGRRYSEDRITSALRASSLHWERCEDIYSRAAGLIAKGAILGWFQGGSEIGPRALGFRSILADPRDPGIKDTLNLKVKHREAFRPFAPAMLEAFAHEFIELPKSVSSQFMLLATPIRESKRNVIPGVVHADDSMRVQLVNATNNPWLAALIESFHRLTQVPVVVNTSFNVAGQPIVESPEDALRCFTSTGIDVLCMNDFLVTKEGAKVPALTR